MRRRSQRDALHGSLPREERQARIAEALRILLALAEEAEQHKTAGPPTGGVSAATDGKRRTTTGA